MSEDYDAMTETRLQSIITYIHIFQETVREERAHQKNKCKGNNIFSFLQDKICMNNDKT